ncbi:hypothetical protein FEP69_06212 [Burkholderia multivorans]|nr:hypothetical protein [Burkholderia multivorans]
MVRLRHVAVRAPVDRDVVHHDERRHRRLQMKQLHDLARDREHAADQQRARHHPRDRVAEPVARERVAGLHRNQRGREIAEREPVHRRHLQRQQHELRDQHERETDRRDERGRCGKRFGRALRAHQQHDRQAEQQIQHERGKFRIEGRNRIRVGGDRVRHDQRDSQCNERQRTGKGRRHERTGCQQPAHYTKLSPLCAGPSRGTRCTRSRALRVPCSAAALRAAFGRRIFGRQRRGRTGQRPRSRRRQR